MNREYAKVITLLEETRRDLSDALDFAAIPMSRCKACKRLAVCQGWICQACGHDPSDPAPREGRR